MPSRPAMAWRWVLPAAVVNVVALTLGSIGYGYNRDELYFRMLPPAWGYVDQPPLTPLLARMTTHLADEVWSLRIPATVASALAVVLLALIARELGGGAAAQALTAWGYGLGVFPLLLGHVLLTSTIDLPILFLVVLLVLRATELPRIWLFAGAVVGLATYNRLLVVVVVGGLVLGLLLLGPRGWIRTPWPWLGALVSLVVAAPMVAYQVSHDWPQLAMGRALSDNNADDVRSQLPFILLVMLGPPLVVVWARGIWWLLQADQRGRFGFLAVGLAVLVAFTWLSGAQPHYPVHLLAVAYAAGCVAMAGWLTSTRVRRIVALALLTVNAAVALVIALPVIPLGSVGSTPVSDMNPLVGDQVGYPAYVRQVAAAYARAKDQGGPVAIIASNYGEAGAIARFGPRLALPRPYSGQNSLYAQGPPPPDVRTVVFVGGQLDDAMPLFESCDVVASLENGVDVDNEEQRLPVAICRNPVEPWTDLWPRLHHLD